jgi:pimeloyl-ACP methyl ester carboxylesterase
MHPQQLVQVGSRGDPSLPTVVFVHANGYPPASYATLLSALTGVGDVWTVAHRPLWSDQAAPKRLSWHQYAHDLQVAVAGQFSEPVWLIGHSMGAVSSLIAAAAQPARFAGVVAIDPVLLLDRLWWPAQILGRINPDGLPIVKRALSRPHQFQGFDAAFEFYRGKRVFQRVADKELWDYVKAGHEPVPTGGVQLRWSGAWEACVYRSAPRMWGVLSRLRVPTLGLIGDRSDVLDDRSVRRWQRSQSQAQLITLSGGHLLPLEAPEVCAAHTSRFIRENTDPQII